MNFPFASDLTATWIARTSRLIHGLRIGHINHIIRIDVNSAWPAELLPVGDELSVRVRSDGTLDRSYIPPYPRSENRPHKSHHSHRRKLRLAGRTASSRR